MSVRDNGVVYTVQDGTTGHILTTLDKCDSKSNIYSLYNINIRDILLLREIITTLDNGHDVFIKIGYKSL